MDKYTKFILTVIAVAMIGILFKGEKIITSAHAIEKHQHHLSEIRGSNNEMLPYFIQAVVMNNCWAKGITRDGLTHSDIICRDIY